MSQENVELAMLMHEAARRGDVEAAQDFLAADVVATEVRGPLDSPSVFRGREALLGHYTQLVDSFDDLVREVDEFVEVGDWVISVGRWMGKGRSSGAPVEVPATIAARFRDGKIVGWLLNFESKEEALEAVRLRK